MANALTAFNPAYWTPTMQETFLKESVALGIANTELRADLKDGDTLHKPYGSYPRVQTYIKGTDITVKDISSTDDTLTVATAKVASFYVDDIDKIQNKYDTIKEFASIAQRQLNNTLDQAVFSEHSNAGTTISGASIGEAAGGIVMTAANTANIFTAAGRTLNSKKRIGGDRFALIGPRMLETIQNYVGGRETVFGEVVSDNGRVANRFGFGLRLSNNLPYSATLTQSTIAIAADSLTINGVTFTAAANGAASAAGSWSIDVSAANSITNLVALINGTGTPGATTYADLSAENRQLIEESGIVAVATATTLTLTGYGDIVVTESLTPATSVWSLQTQYSLMGQVGAIDLVTQVAPNVVFRDAQLRLGKYVHPWMLFGKKTFTRMQDSLVRVQFDVSAWV